MDAKARSVLTIVATLLVGVALLTPALASTTTGTYTLGPNLGVVNYTINHSTGNCQFQPPGDPMDVFVTYNIDTYSSTYVNSAANINQTLPSFTYISGSPGPNAGNNDTCPTPTSGNGPFSTYTSTTPGSAYTINVYPGPVVVIDASGYVNPKFVVLGVYYAPPGSKSTVDYTNSNLVSNTITTKSSLAESYSQSSSQMASFGASGGLKGWKAASVDASVKATMSFTEGGSEADSTAITLQKSSSTSFIVPGPACSYCGVDHDYDQIAVWLNPVQLFTLTNNGVIQPNGYGFSTLDQPGMDIYYVYAGELSGTLPMRSSTVTAFARAWASVETWPTNEGSTPWALTAQDEQNILKLDPYWNCTYKSPVGDATDCAEPPSSSRFTESTNASFPFEQPEPGGQPDTKTYGWTYTSTDAQGEDITTSFSQSFGLETSFSFKIFGLGFQDSLTQTWTLTSTYERSTLYTTSNTSSAQASITGPACNVVNGACSPVYPPLNAYDPITCAPLSLPTAFGQGDNMYLYQDNLFGTFMIEPYGQP